MKKRVIVFLLMMAVISSFTIPAMASSKVANPDIEISPMLTYILEAEAQLYINSSGTATVETYVTGNSLVTSTKATVKLQQYKNGSWTTLKTWYPSSSTRILNFYDTYNVTSGYSYRVQSVATAYSGTSSESVTLTTSSRSY